MKRICVLGGVASVILFVAIGRVADSSQMLVNPKYITLTDAGVTMRGCIYTYEAGTTTKKTTYSDKTLTTANPNPIQCDTRGECGPIYFEGLLKVVMTNPSGSGTCPDNPANVEYTVDNIEGAGSSILDFQTCSDFSSLATAIATIDTDETTLYIDCDATLTDNLTIPANIHTVFLKRYKITTGTYMLTINGPVTADRFQIFDTSGGGSVKFGTGSVDEIYPEWWGAVGDGVNDDTGALQAAVNAAITSKGVLSLGVSTYRITSTITAGKGLSIRGVSSVGAVSEACSRIRYHGPSPFMIFSDQPTHVVWSDFVVDLDGSSYSDVDIFDFDRGGTYNRFTSVQIAGAHRCRHGWIWRGISQVTGTVNSGQWGNVWTNCRVIGNTGYCWYMYGQDVLGARCNDNIWIGGSIPSSAEAGFYVNGNGNSWFGVNFNKVSGPYSVIIEGDQAQDNNFHSCYFDQFSAPPAKKIKLVRNRTANASIAGFYGCIGITGAFSEFEHYNRNESVLYDTPCVSVVGTTSIMMWNDIKGSGEESVMYGFRASIVTRTPPYNAVLSDCGRILCMSGGSTHEITLPTIGTGEGYAQRGFWVGVLCRDSDKPITVKPASGQRIHYLPANQPVELSNSMRLAVFTADADNGMWVISYTNGTLNVPFTSSGSMGARGAISDIFVYTNEGATGSVTLTLPSATKGAVARAKFARVENYPFIIKPNGSNYFRGSSPGKYKSLDSVGAILQIICVVNSVWEVEYTSGTITNEP